MEHINVLVRPSGMVLLIAALTLNLAMDGFAQSSSPWEERAEMPLARKSHSSCVLEGKVYVIGGKPQDSPFVSSVDIFDPQLNSWTEGTSMVHGRVVFSTCIYEGKILAIGGSEGMFGNTVSTIETYDPSSDSWSSLTSIPVAGIGHTASVVNDKIYIFGGTAGGTSMPYNSVQVYDIIVDEWSTVTNLPTSRSNASSAIVNDKIYVMGGTTGYTGAYLGLSTLEVYDPVEDSWMSKTEMLVPRKNFASCTIDGKIYVFGGSNLDCGGILSSAERYDPETDSWTLLTEAPGILGAVGASAWDGKIVITGGNTTACPPAVKSSTYLYNPAVDDSLTSAHSFLNPQFSIFPNPASEVLVISSGSLDDQAIEIRSMDGQIVINRKLEGNNLQLNLSNLAAGIYFITVRGPHFVDTRKLIIQ